MKLVITPDATADRLADAALLLLDASRAAFAEAEAEGGNSDRREAAVVSMSVQAVISADHWPASGQKDLVARALVEPKLVAELFSGAAIGLGLSLAAVPDAEVRKLLMLIICASIGEGEKLGLKARNDRVPK